MGQKVNPHGLRVGVIKDWDSRWYAEADFADCLVEDYDIRKFLKNRLKNSGVSKIEIERASDRVKVIIYTAKPGVVIGMKCWEKTIKTLSLQLQPRQCRPGCFGNIRRWQGRTMREGTTSLDRGKMHAQIALFTRDTRQNWLKSLQKGMDIWTVWCAGT